MLADADIRAALDAMMNAFDVPQVPLHAIKRRAAMPRATRRNSSVALRAVSAAAAALVVVLTISPARTLGWITSAEERIARILQWAPPPPPPKALEPSIAARTGDLAQIQARVSFRIVPPSGLPSGVIRERLWTTPTLVYSKVTRKWSKGEPEVWFGFDRSRGRSFALAAERFDPRFGPPPALMFEDDSTGGRMLVKHRHFAWRNGTQLMTVDEDPSLGAGEIEAIRTAMGGVPIRGAVTARELNEGTLIRRIVVAAP